MQPGYHDLGVREPRCNKIGIVGPLLKSDVDVLFVDGYKSGCIYEVPEDVAGLGRLVAVADLRTQQSIKLLAIRVSCRSQSTFMATADERASIWKKSMPSAILFSMIMR